MAVDRRIVPWKTYSTPIAFQKYISYNICQKFYNQLIYKGAVSIDIWKLLDEQSYLTLQIA